MLQKNYQILKNELKNKIIKYSMNIKILVMKFKSINAL